MNRRLFPEGARLTQVVAPLPARAGWFGQQKEILMELVPTATDLSASEVQRYQQKLIHFTFQKHLVAEKEICSFPRISL